MHAMAAPRPNNRLAPPSTAPPRRMSALLPQVLRVPRPLTWQPAPQTSSGRRLQMPLLLLGTLCRPRGPSSRERVPAAWEARGRSLQRRS